MSTKAIREALETLDTLVECVNGKVAGRCAHCIGKAALAEVEAIERAAMAIADTDAESGREEFNQAVALLERITEQRKAH